MNSRISKERLAGSLLFVLVGYAIVSIFAGAMLWTIGMDSAVFIPPPLSTGTVAPPFELQSLSGDKVSLEQHKGRPVVLMFWGAS